MTEDFIARFQNAETERVKNAQSAESQFLDRRAEKTIGIYKETLQQFMEYMTENNFPFAAITEVDGNQHLSYELFSTDWWRDPDTGDTGKTHHGFPLLLLISGSGEVVYRQVRGDVLSPVDVVDTIEDYRNLPQNDLGKKIYDDTHIFDWSACLIRHMEYASRAVDGTIDPSKYGRDLSWVGVWSIGERMKQQYFPEGYNYREYRERLLAKQALPSEQ